MKKAGQNIILVSLFLIFALLIVAVIFTVPDGRMDTAAFWIGFAFAFPFNLVTFVAIHLWCGKKNGNALVQMPVAYRVGISFAAIYLVLGAVFMYAPILNFIIPAAVFAVVSVVYLIVAMYVVSAANHIMNDESKIKSKVAYIALLKEDIEVIIPRVSDSAAKNALADLAEAVRFSDPMSHPSLAGVEMQLTVEVQRIAALAQEGKEADIVSAVNGAKALLESRNRRCIMLK